MRLVFSLILVASQIHAASLSKEIQGARTPSHSIQSIILNRWSPRSMTGEALSDHELMPLFEAARWAPSSFNHQPWRFLYAKRGTPEWSLFYNLLVDFNQTWCQNASALIVVISQNNFEHNNTYSPTHSYDTGAAWMALALEGNARGYVVHGIGGFDVEKARKDLKIPEGYTIEAMAAVGKRAPKARLPQHLREMEAPSDRKALSQLVFCGTFSPKKNEQALNLLAKE